VLEISGIWIPKIDMKPTTFDTDYMHEAPLLTSDVARVAGVSRATVIEWERRGLLSAERTEGGVRLFRREDVERVARERAERKGQRT
jgi:excisionase family DNA binding protein